MLNPVKFFTSIQRLHFSTAISIVTHIIFLSIGTAVLGNTQQRFHSIEALIVNTMSNPITPLTARFQAQNNSHGGGSTTEANKIIRSFVVYDRKNSQGLHKKQEKSSTIKENFARWITRSDSISVFFISPSTHPHDQRNGHGHQKEDLKKLLKSMRAQLHKLMQIEHSGKKRLFIGIAAKKTAHAEYTNAIAEKIERIGSQHFPEHALNHPFSIIVTISIRQNGTLEKIKVDKGSGTSSLDKSALDIISRAFPAEPFPAAIKKDYFAIDMTRTIYFQPRGTRKESSKT